MGYYVTEAREALHLAELAKDPDVSAQHVRQALDILELNTPIPGMTRARIEALVEEQEKATRFIFTQMLTAREWRAARLAVCAQPLNNPAGWARLSRAESALSRAMED